MRKRILIITNCADLHADIVAEKLAARGERPFRLNLDEFPAQFSIDLAFSGNTWNGGLLHIPSQNCVQIDEIGAVWVRKSADFSFVHTDLAPQEYTYAKQETEHTLSSILFVLNCYWMSHPLCVRSALWKGEQLARAARMGFLVPPSILTNSPGAVRSFWNSNADGVVFKSLSSPLLAADKVGPDERLVAGLPTTRIGEDDLDALEAVKELPCFFQQYVAKAYELRVTVIGNNVFAAKIHSQSDPRTLTDYRDFSAEIPYEMAQLPASVEQRCRDFVTSYGLTFGAIDLIVTPDGDYVFLENNPAGQFLFVEQLVPELAMTDAVAQCLIEGAQSAR